MLQSTLLFVKNNAISEIFVLNFTKSNNSKGFMDNFPYLCDIYI